MRPLSGLAALVLASALAAPVAGASAGRRPVFEVRAFGARGDGVTDDSAALQAALDAARRAGGGVVHLGPGKYVVAPRGPLEAIGIGSGVWLRGDGPSSVVTVKRGVGSYRALLSNAPRPTSQVQDVTLSDLRIEQDCAGSGGQVDPGDEGHQFFVYLAWGGEDITIERVHFDGVCGIHTVSINAASVRRVAIRDNRFRFVRGPNREATGSYDNSAVYLHGRTLAATGNVFESTAADGARGAIELHGADGVAARNTSRWYHACVRVVGTSGDDERPPRNDFTVEHNTCLGANDAINVWAVTGHGVRGVQIRDNTIRLDPEPHLAHTSLRYFMGISFVWDAASPALRGEIAHVAIERNSIEVAPVDPAHYPPSTGSGGIMLMNAGPITNVVVRDNTVVDCPTEGVRLESKGRGTSATDVRIVGNRVVMRRAVARGAQPAGITAAGRLADVAITGNLVALPASARSRAIRAVASARDRVEVGDNQIVPAEPWSSTPGPAAPGSADAR